MSAPAARKIWFALFVLVIFCLGAAAGVVADRYRASSTDRPVFGQGRLGRIGGPMRGRPPRPAQIAERMGRELNLTPDQRTRLEAVLERNADRLQQFRRRTGAEFDALRKQLDSEISAILTPEQRETFEAQRRRRDRMRSLRERRPPGS